MHHVRRDGRFNPIPNKRDYCFVSISFLDTDDDDVETSKKPNSEKTVESSLSLCSQKIECNPSTLMDCWRSNFFILIIRSNFPWLVSVKIKIGQESIPKNSLFSLETNSNRIDVDSNNHIFLKTEQMKWRSTIKWEQSTFLNDLFWRHSSSLFYSSKLFAWKAKLNI